jgi:aminoglycoside 2'-N-acetyltransferase I
VIEVRTAHTAEVDREVLGAANRLLDGVFDGDWTEEDWDHSLGGVHVLVWEDGELVGHGAVVLRRLLHGGRALRTGYVEGVGVRKDRQGRGHGALIMGEVERVIRGGSELGALSSSDAAMGFYAGRGWQVWRGPLFRLTPRGIERTEDEDGGLYVLPVTARLDLDGEIVCDWRDGETW